MMHVLHTYNYFVLTFISWKNSMEQIKFRKKKLEKWYLEVQGIFEILQNSLMSTRN